MSLCADHENICGEASELFGHAVFSSTLSLQLLGTKHMKARGAKCELYGIKLEQVHCAEFCSKIDG
jgi:hypothetical protein